MPKKLPVILAIETSCDETAAAVIRDGRVASSVIASQAALHNEYGGVVPEVAAREHVPAIVPTIDLALVKGRTRLKDVDVVAVTKGPGLATSLHVGIDAAKSLALALGRPLLPVNHMEAHVYANFMESEVEFPALILVVSGGHTMLVLMKGHGRYQILGETMDDAAGEAFDKTAKVMGLGYPGGPLISKLAEDGDPARFPFPRPMANSKDLRFSFSGLKTAVLYQVQGMGRLTAQDKRDLAASTQAAIIDVLTTKLEQAIMRCRPKTVMLGGGVAANKKLREALIRLADRHLLQCSIPPAAYCTDNAAMIGLAAHYRIQAKRHKFTANFRAEPNLELGQ